jgi:hypothetical protein
MRSRNFDVPVDLMVEFAALMDEHGFDNVIDGSNDDDEIQVRVDYESNEKPVINKIQDWIDQYKENQEDEDDDDEDDDDDDEDDDS